jgi:hypothetical protein
MRSGGVASSLHVTGFYDAAERIGPEEPVRPDSFYGVSKACGENLGRLYADKHRLEVVCVRIGTFADQPTTPRHLSTWLSPRDAVELFYRCLIAPDVGFTVVYRTSATQRGWWDPGPVERLGYRPVDDAERWASKINGAAADRPGWWRGWWGNRSRMAVRSAVMSVVFMTTPAWARRANAGETGRASTDIARSIASGMCLMRPGWPLAVMSRSTSWVKVRFSEPVTSRTWPRSEGSWTARSATATTSWAETKLTGLRPGRRPGPGRRRRAWPDDGDPGLQVGRGPEQLDKASDLVVSRP